MAERRVPTGSERAALAGEARGLVRLARYAGMRGEDALDVAHEALLDALEAWGTWEDGAAQAGEPIPRRWLGAFVFRAVQRRRHHEAREARHVIDPDVLERAAAAAAVDAARVDAASAETTAIARSVLRFVERATTPERWHAWAAWHLDGLDVTEIAAAAGVPATTIYNRLRLAREDFTAALRREDARASTPVGRPRRAAPGEPARPGRHDAQRSVKPGAA